MKPPQPQPQPQPLTIQELKDMLDDYNPEDYVYFDVSDGLSLNGCHFDGMSLSSNNIVGRHLVISLEFDREFDGDE